MRRANGGLGLVAAMESAKLEGKEEGKEELGQNAESLETDLAEVNDSAAEGEAAQAEIDEGQDAAEALESFRVALEGINGNGGLDQGGAMILSLATERIYNKLGLAGHQSVPALESFGGSSSRVQAGTIAMEDFKEQIQRVWKAIVEAIKKAIAWVKEHVNAVFGAAEKLVKRAAALEERARSANGTKKANDFENDRLAKALAIDGAPATNVVQHAKDLKDVVSALVTKGAEIANKVGEDAVQAIESQDGAKVGAVLKLVQPIVGEAVANPEAEGLASPGAGMKLTRSKELFGGMAVLSRTPAGEDAGLEAVKFVGYSVGKFSSKIKEPTNKKLVTLSTADAGSLAGVVKEIGEELVAYKKNADKLAATQDKLVKAAEKVANGAGNEEDAEKRKGLSALQGLANAANRIITVPGVQISKFALGTGKSLLDYVELSLKQYGEK